VRILPHLPITRSDRSDTEDAAVMMAKLPKDRHTAVIAGAFTGVSAKVFARYFDRVIAFEPNPDSFEHLVNRVSNDCPNVTCAPFALWSKNGRIIFRDVADAPYLSRTVSPDEAVGGELLVNARQLDNFTFLAVDLLQVDVAGSELEVLEGAVDTIYKHRPVIVVEMGKGPRNPPATKRWLEERGYRSHSFINTDEVFKYVE
jgi:FkbM family methyltransferase